MVYRRGNSARHHEVAMIIDPPLVEQWRFDVGAGVGIGGALIVDEVVLVGTRKGHILAVDLNSGKRLGRARFDAPIEGGMMYYDNVLYIPMISKKKTVVAYNINSGDALWKLNTTPIESGLLVHEDVVVTVDREGFVKGLNKENGEVNWELQLGEKAGIIASPLLVDSKVAVVNEDGMLHLFDVDSGEEAWSRDLMLPVHSSMTFGDDKIFVPSTRGVLMSLDPSSGTTIWEHVTPDSTVRFAAPGYDKKSDMLVVGGTDGKMRAFDASSGEPQWETQLEGAIMIAPLFTGNTIYIGTLRGKVYALDKFTGESIWEHKVTGRVKSAMAAQNGKIVVLSETQQLYMFQSELHAEVSP